MLLFFDLIFVRYKDDAILFIAFCNLILIFSCIKMEHFLKIIIVAHTAIFLWGNGVPILVISQCEYGIGSANISI